MKKLKFSYIFLSQKPFLLFMVLFVLLLALILTSFPLFGRLVDSWNDLNNNSNLVSQSTRKKEQLGGLDQGNLSLSTKKAVLALPEKTGVLLTLARVRELTQNSGISLAKVQVSIDEGDGNSLPKNAVRVDVEGPLVKIKEFLADLERSLPYIRILTGKTSTVSGISTTTISIETYWKKFPTKLPGINEAITSLNESEQKLLSGILNFAEKKTTSTPTSNLGRSNPFSF